MEKQRKLTKWNYFPKVSLSNQDRRFLNNTIFTIAYKMAGIL
jgi:hypothetical protein